MKKILFLAGLMFGTAGFSHGFIPEFQGILVPAGDSPLGRSKRSYHRGTFETTSSDTVSGTFDYSGPEGEFSGDFTGTMTSTYDAYGTVTYFLDEATNSIPANRLSVVLDITFGTADFPSAGTLTQTSHYYYDEFTAWPYVRSVSSHFVVPPLNIDRETTYLEKASDLILSNMETNADVIKIFPNPVKDILTISGIRNGAEIRISDMNGRLMLDQQIQTNSIDLSSFQTGMYLVRITSGTAITVQKIIRE